MAGEDLGYKPSVVEQAKFVYSPLGKVFNKGLHKDYKKEGLLKMIEKYWRWEVKAIEDQGKKQLDQLKNISESKPLKKITYPSKLCSGAKKLHNEIKEEKNNFNPETLVCVQTDGTIYNVNAFKSPLEFASDIHIGKISLKDAEKKHPKMFLSLVKLKERTLSM